MYKMLLISTQLMMLVIVYCAKLIKMFLFKEVDPDHGYQFHILLTLNKLQNSVKLWY